MESEMENAASVVNAEQDIEMWDRQTGEPKQWYLRFQRYYLYRGLARSVRRAYVAFLMENYPQKAEDIIVAGRAYTRWLDIARQFNWKERATAWDEQRNQELHLSVLQASRYLMENTMTAAESLVEALENPRLKVVAANSILDRAGLPTVTRQEVLDFQIGISADEMAKVKDAVEEWEKSIREPNG